MIYFTKYETGYRLFQTTTMYNSKHIYMWFEVFFFSDEQFKTFVEFKNIIFKNVARQQLGWIEYTEEQKRQVNERAQELKDEFIAWYLKTGDLTRRIEVYNGYEDLVSFRISYFLKSSEDLTLVKSSRTQFSYYIHWNRRIKDVVTFKEEIQTGNKLRRQRMKCSKSTKPLRIKSILKQIWNDDLEIDIAYKMLVES